ncbi:DUF4240 domain-containing protein [Nonomuraea sp. NPDC005692]|uniref:DUF4240 domain-containing protein n=1 Tax=Nonomuraea sp. NPDC005692 TaxID=3157168 RepID=UPI0033F10BE3
MDIDGFWELIERSGRAAGTKDARLAWMLEELSGRSPEELIDYQCQWTVVQARGCTMDLYAAHWFVFGSGSLDGFEYFVSWLISLGRESFEKVADCPDLLIELPQVLRHLDLKRAYYSSKGVRSRDMQRRLEEEWPEFELLAYVAHEAYERITGSGSGALYEAVHERGVFSGFPLIPALGSVPDGEQWDFDDPREFVRRLPRTARHRGL